MMLLLLSELHMRKMTVRKQMQAPRLQVRR